MIVRLIRLSGVLLLVLAGLTAGTANAQPAPSATNLNLPFPAGTVWKVLQGYNGGTHTPGAEQYALDLVRESGNSGGAEVLAPASGTVWYAQAPGTGNGCFSIKIDGGEGLIVQLCHVVLNRALQPNTPVKAGTPLAVVGPDGRVGNNGIAHVHLSLHRTADFGVNRVPAPFALPHGAALEGLSLPANGTRNQYGCPGAGCVGRIVSTNGGGAAGPAAPSGTPPVAPPPASGNSALPPSLPSTPARSSAPPAGPLRVGARAVVTGAGDCVNVREEPSLTGKVKQCLPDGARSRLVDGPVNADGRVWWRLDGLGWAVSTYLSAVPVSLEIGGSARVSAGGDCLNVRSAPATGAPAIACLPDGRPVMISGGPVEADGVTWWRLDSNAWAAGQFLTPDE